MTLGLTIEVTIQDILDLYGPPSFITIGQEGVPEHWYWGIRMHYPESGFSFYAYTQEFSDEIRASTEIDMATYYIPIPDNELKSQLADDGDYSGRQFFNWEGYGKINVLYSVEPTK